MSPEILTNSAKKEVLKTNVGWDKWADLIVKQLTDIERIINEIRTEIAEIKDDIDNINLKLNNIDIVNITGRLDAIDVTLEKMAVINLTDTSGNEITITKDNILKKSYLFTETNGVCDKKLEKITKDLENKFSPTEGIKRFNEKAKAWVYLLMFIAAVLYGIWTFTEYKAVHETLHELQKSTNTK